MPSDYGDDSGEKLVDWMLRIGQDAGGAAIVSSTVVVDIIGVMISTE